MAGAGGCHGASLGFEALGTFTVRMLVGALVTFVLVIVVSLLAFWHAGCPKGGFQCRDGQCLARSRRCDNEENCSEREDEEDCMLPDDVDVKHLSFPTTNSAPCHICVCPSPHSLHECVLPSPPHLSLAHCHLTTNSPNRDESGVRFPRSASSHLPQSYIRAARNLGRGRRAAVNLNATQGYLKGKWLARTKKIGMDVYRTKGIGTVKTSKELLLDEKWKKNVSRRVKGRSTVFNAQNSRLFYDSIKTPQAAHTGSLDKNECVPRCPTQHQQDGCQHKHSFMDKKKKKISSSLNWLRRSNTMAFRQRGRHSLVLKGNSSGLRGPFHQMRRTRHITHCRSVDGAEPRHARHTYPEAPKLDDEPLLKTTTKGINNTIVPSVSQYHTPAGKQIRKTRMRRQLTTGDAVSNLEIDTDSHPLEHTSRKVDFDNTTSMMTPPANLTLEEEEEEHNVDLNIEEEAKGVVEEAASHSTKVQQSGEVWDSCHCELSSHLKCVGTHIKNVSDRIVGEMKQLTVTRDDAPTLEDKVFSRYDSLRTLSLTSGGFTNLPHRLFVSLKFLEHLYLTGNMIKVVDEQTCVGLAILKVFFINKNKITFFNLTCFQHTPALQDLNMGHNLLTLESQSFPSLPHLTSLYLNNNRLTNVTSSLLVHLTAIRTLDLRDNTIEMVHPKAFLSLTHLQLLMMSGNRVTSVAGLFHGLTKLAMLKLEELDLHDIHPKNFHILPGLKFVYFDTFRYCRYVPTVAICLPNFDGVTSTEDLLGWRTLRVAVWVMALVTLSANIVVIFCRAISRKDNKILKLFVKNLAAADLLMGVYLVVIGVQDAMTRGSFNSHALQWADSYTCIFAGVLAMVSSETSVFILSFMSLERYLYISEALDGRTLSLRGARLCLAAIWLTSISLAFFPILWVRSFYGNNPVCFPLYINEPYLTGWQYSTFIFLGLNFINMVVIFGSYVGLFINIRGTRLSTSRSSDEMNFTFRFFFIVVTNCLCWLPIMCLKVAALAHVDVHQGVYAWLVILVLPINSAVNPALYTFSTSQFQQQMTSAITTLRRLRYRHNSDTEALRHSSTRIGGNHLHHLHASPPEPLLPTTNPTLVEVRGIHLKNLPSPETLSILSPHDLRNGLLLSMIEAPAVPEESLSHEDGDGDNTSDNVDSVIG